VQEHEDVGVQAPVRLVAGVERVVHLLRQRFAVLVQPAVEAHDEDVRVGVRDGRRLRTGSGEHVRLLDAPGQAGVLEHRIPHDQEDSGDDDHGGPPQNDGMHEQLTSLVGTGTILHGAGRT
jgi:hypothetical protein